MATLREIKTRIKSVKNTQQITKAMKMVAAAKMRRAQDRMFSARPYAEKIRDLIQNLTASVENPQLELLKSRPVQNVTLVVITSDRGLCGSFNTNVIKKAVMEADAHRDLNLSIVTLGKKGYDFFRKRGYNIVDRKVDFYNDLQFAHANEIANSLIKRFITGETDAVKIIYNEFKSVARQNLVVDKLLPISLEDFETQQTGDYIYEPDQAAILEALLPRHIRTQVWRALLESFASEQAARMIAMENATDNANEIIRQLTLQYNKARQAAITKEILEIVGGAEALKSS
ncbi:MAG: ATP synthase F1 subunit gamma [Calditrichaeota bacterium]|nr:ATP synthase F1 subunit gamma [Calditrichota bacterium]MCB0267133.1 ATP synthase F1 subunit gamma [Calditrichota bacterium]